MTDVTAQRVQDFTDDARRMSLKDFRTIHGDLFLVSLKPPEQQDKGFVAATRVATHLDELESDLEALQRDASDAPQPEDQGDLAVYTPRKGSESSNLLSIGALEHNDVVVDHDSVSSDHAALIRLEGGYFVQDSGSTNGTLVNGERAGEDALALCSGDELQIGLCKVRFLTADAFQRLAARAGPR
jgi:hypothetical protein